MCARVLVEEVEDEIPESLAIDCKGTSFKQKVEYPRVPRARYIMQDLQPFR